MSLTTPENISSLQRKLYGRAKAEKAPPRNKCDDFSFCKTKFVLRFFHVAPKSTGPQGAPAPRASSWRQKFGERHFGALDLWIWIYCNPLKSLKTAKTFL